MESKIYLYITLAAIVAIAIAAFQYLYKVKSQSKNNFLLAFLRFLSVFSLLLLLINPQIKTQQLSVVKPKLVVAVDNSSSIKYLKEEITVKNTVKALKVNQNIQDKFDVSYFSFSETLNESDSLKFNQNKTSISNALSGVNTLFEENNSVVIITDGNQTLGTDYSYIRSKNKIYPVVVGDTIAHEDLKISKLNVNKYSFLNNTFPVEVFVNYNGENAVTSNLTVLKGNSPVYRRTLQLSPKNNSERVSFDLKATSVGMHNYSVVVSKIATEKNTINNQKNFSVQVINEQAKIAIVSPILHPDLGMLKRSIETNKQRKVEILKLSNNLKLKDYQLIIIYQPNNKFKPFFNTLEKSKSNFLLITGTKTDWNFLNTIQKDFSKTAINQSEEYFPVKNSSYTSFLVEDFNFDNLPPLKTKFGELIFNIPHETLLFNAVNGIQTDKPLLATFTKEGRKGAILAGEGIWKWRVYSNSQEKTFFNFDSFINKLVQYLSSKKKLSRLDLTYESLVYQNDAIKIDATYFDSNYEVDTRANLTLILKNKQTEEVKRYPFRVIDNHYTTSVSSLAKGDYTFTVIVNEQKTQKSGGFKVLDYNIEQQFTYANTDALKNLVTNSNGILFHTSSINRLIDKLLNDNELKPIQKSTAKQASLIDWKWLLAIIVIALSLEWFIRKFLGRI